MMMSQTFGQEVYEYIVTLVPYWRATTEAWLLSNERYLVGIGVLRNYGGDLMVVTLQSPEEKEADQLRLILSDKLRLLQGSLDNIVVVYDDRRGLTSESLCL